MTGRLLLAAMVALAIGVAGCSTATTPSPPTTAEATGGTLAPADTADLRNHTGYAFPPGPDAPVGPTDPDLVALLDEIFGSIVVGEPIDGDRIRRVAEFDDPRSAWLMTDLVRFIGPSDTRSAALEVYVALVGSIDGDPVLERSTWQSTVDHLIAWDVPAHDEYGRWKAQLYGAVDDRWAVFFDDTDADIDWRHVSWGGVFMDDRPLGDNQPCQQGCIPAIDDPGVTDADGGAWYPDEAIVFGVTVNGESRAYPKNIMEVHEMVLDTVGGVRLGIPYCTLCGSAQAYQIEAVPEGVTPPLLRTSGLLIRSNKMMFDLETFSMLDTFTGEAVSGPLQDAEVVLPQVTVVTSTWGDWKAAHPDTTIVAEDGGIGRVYAADPLEGRDLNGPIFPIGNVDRRLPAQAKVFGVLAGDGTPVAFPVAASREVLDNGGVVRLLGIELVADAGGVRAIDGTGAEVAGHEAFWFAWSQFYGETVVWSSE